MQLPPGIWDSVIKWRLRDRCLPAFGWTFVTDSKNNGCLVLLCNFTVSVRIFNFVFSKKKLNCFFLIFPLYCADGIR